MAAAFSGDSVAFSLGAGGGLWTGAAPGGAVAPAAPALRAALRGGEAPLAGRSSEGSAAAVGSASAPGEGLASRSVLLALALGAGALAGARSAVAAASGRRRRRRAAGAPSGASGARAVAVQRQVAPGSVEAGPSDQLFVVSCYTRFDNLAHGPRGKEAKRSLYTYRMDPENGQLMLLSVTKEEVMNPAFSRLHPTKNVLYTCTESVSEPGEIVSWEVDEVSGRLTKLSSVSAGGTSTCYLSLDKECRNMLVVNYWDATIGVFGIDQHSGRVTKARSFYDNNQGRPMRAKADKHVNHSENDESAQAERQADPHAHAVVIEKYTGRIAFVPDLGMDVIRQFYYDPKAGNLTPTGVIKSGPDGRRALGPRYIEFHPKLPIAYVVNELSSEVSIFEFDGSLAKELVDAGGSVSTPTLRLLQTVRTIPEGYPGDGNTCGRITVHSSGDFVLVSNRGHDSIAVFRVEYDSAKPGMLTPIDIFHTRGATPRHFQFDASGQWLITANQDSDKIAVFRFNLSTGKLEWTGNDYSVPSPNFVCSVPRKARARAAAAMGDIEEES